MGIQMVEEEKEIEFEVKFKFTNEEIDKLTKLIKKMEDTVNEFAELGAELEDKEYELELPKKGEKEEYEKRKQEVEKLKERYDKLNKELDELEKQLRQLLGISDAIEIIYGPNDGTNRIYPVIIIPSYVDSDYLFWVEISPKMALYVPKTK